MRWTFKVRVKWYEIRKARLDKNCNSGCCWHPGLCVSCSYKLIIHRGTQMKGLSGHRKVHWNEAVKVSQYSRDCHSLTSALNLSYELVCLWRGFR